MNEVKASRSQEIEIVTGPQSAVAQLLNARMFDLEVIVLAQAKRIEELETRLSHISSRLQKHISDEMRLMRRSGRL